MEVRTALITGGGSGIGRATALRLSREGITVAIADRDMEALERVRAELVSQGAVAYMVEVDISDQTSVQAMVDSVLQETGSIDALVHCAGILGSRVPVLEMDPTEWERVISTNLSGTFFVAQAVGREMVLRQFGTMVLVASDAGLYGLPELSHYSASKGGVIAFTRALAGEIGARGVTVNALNPGVTETPMLRVGMTRDQMAKAASQDPLGRLGQPEDVAETILFLVQTGGRYMTGQLVTTKKPQ